MQLPALSEVVPADILHDKRFAQFAPYSSAPAVSILRKYTVGHDETDDIGIDLQVKDEPASPAWSSCGLPSPGGFSSGSRTPSLSPSPSPAPQHAHLPGSQPHAANGAVWISQTSASSSAAYQTVPATQQNIVWMPTNMNYPAPCEPHPARRSESITPTPPSTSQTSLVDPKQNYKLVASDPAHADAIVHVAPGGQPKLLIGMAARQQLTKLTTVPESQRGKVVFYKVVRNS